VDKGDTVIEALRFFREKLANGQAVSHAEMHNHLVSFIRGAA
jgi:hypothetical protein